MKLLDKILIANRGEIALRIIRSAKQLGIKTVSIYTELEKEADFVKLADEAVSLGNGELDSTYLDITKIIQIAISTGAQAIHPGYGFLSENHAFAKTCEENQLIFIGPSSEVLNLMSSKPAAKQLAVSLGIPVAFSQKINPQSSLPDEKLFHYPLLIKASFGGGGKGMELVHSYQEFKQKVEKSSRIAQNYFGNGELFIEQYIQNARHVEVQIIGDNFNNILHLYERECSIQRNHQKIIEEAPAIFLSPELRAMILSAALKIGKAVNYSGAGTVEFLVDESGNYFFMEMNPRIQVEHAVTEEITGIDIVNEQLRIASGFPISYKQEDIKLTGHAIELRIYAENPSQNFTPSTAPLLSVNLPEYSELRIESDINSSQSLGNQFDPLLLKLIATGKDRESAISMLRNGIKNLNIIGPETNVKYLETILTHPGYQQNVISVEFCKKNHKILTDNYINKFNSDQLNYLVALAIWKIYLKSGYGETNNNPWNYLGYWRSASAKVPLSIDDEVYMVIPDLKEKSRPAFVLNGIRTVFTTGNQSGNWTDIVIDNQTTRISAIFENHNNLKVSCENIHHNILFPGLLTSYLEIQSDLDDSSKFESGEIKSPLHGKILEINVIENQIIKKGDLLMVIEAMKSENRILSPMDAKVKKIAVNVGAQVTDRMPLIFLEDFK
jgi:acetyl/propionyl-CoA carboxylase alpha subunit